MVSASYEKGQYKAYIFNGGKGIFGLEKVITLHELPEDAIRFKKNRWLTPKKDNTFMQICPSTDFIPLEDYGLQILSREN